MDTQSFNISKELPFPSRNVHIYIYFKILCDMSSEYIHIYKYIYINVLKECFHVYIFIFSYLYTHANLIFLYIVFYDVVFVYVYALLLAQLYFTFRQDAALEIWWHARLRRPGATRQLRCHVGEVCLKRSPMIPIIWLCSELKKCCVNFVYIVHKNS